MLTLPKKPSAEVVQVLDTPSLLMCHLVHDRIMSLAREDDLSRRTSASSGKVFALRKGHLLLVHREATSHWQPSVPGSFHDVYLDCLAFANARLI